MEFGIPSAYQNIYRLDKVPPARFSEFHKRTNEILGVVFPDEYIRGADAYALWDERNRICGGLIFARHPPFRCLQSIPESTKDEALRKLEDLEDCSEVNGVWIAPQNKSIFISTTFWRQLIEILLDSEKQRFLFTVDHTNRHMLGHIAFLQPKVLYSGATLQLDGMNQVADEVILSIRRDVVEASLGLLDRLGNGERLPADTDTAQRIAKRHNTQAILSAFDQRARL